MNRILIFLTFLISFSLYSQDYPIIEENENGQKVVVFTLEQAQSIDNSFDLLNLLKDSRIDCDSLNISYIKIIDENKNQILIYEKLIEENEGKISDIKSQLLNSQEQNNNLSESLSLCDEQKINNDKQIEGLESDIKKTKWKSMGTGFILGVLTTIIYNNLSGK